MVVGLMVKVPVWPLHTWLPPAHTDRVPTGGSVLLAGGAARSSAPTAWSGWSFLLCRKGFRDLSPYLAGLGVVGILWGGLACLVERDLKRLVAYSSVAHMGFVAVGIASGSPQGLQGALSPTSRTGW